MTVAMDDFFRDMRVVVTGAAGTIGQALVTRLLEMPVAEVRALDNNESELYHLDEDLQVDSRYRSYLCDIRDPVGLSHLFAGMDLVFHAAALKHVYLCERSPTEAIKTNIVGTQNAIEAAAEARVKKFLFTSSDKAVNPTSVMGTSKLMGERLTSSANALYRPTAGTVFAATRFGNVAGSRGSVIPSFLRQIASGGSVRLTHPDMTRFVMTRHAAVEMVLEAMIESKGGEVFVSKMPVVRIEDLARLMIEVLAPHYRLEPGATAVEMVGMRPGEKLWEELLSDEELRRTMDSDRWFIIKPAIDEIFRTEPFDGGQPARPSSQVGVYRSCDEPACDRQSLLGLLSADGVLPEELASLVKRIS